MAGGKKYFWDPFPETTDKSKTLTRQKYQKKEKNCTILDCNVTTGLTFRQPLDGGSLQNIEDDSTLLIFAHGDWKSNILGNTRNVEVGGQVQTITPKILADMLRRDGLPSTHIWIRLLSCYGGGLNVLDKFHDWKLAAGSCFAKVLAQELGSTHAMIRVGGYEGANLTAWDKTHVCINPHAGKITKDDLMPSMGIWISWFNFMGRKLELKREDLAFDLEIIALLH